MAWGVAVETPISRSPPEAPDRMAALQSLTGKVAKVLRVVGRPYERRGLLKSSTRPEQGQGVSRRRRVREGDPRRNPRSHEARRQIVEQRCLSAQQMGRALDIDEQAVPPSAGRRARRWAHSASPSDRAGPVPGRRPPGRRGERSAARRSVPGPGEKIAPPQAEGASLLVDGDEAQAPRTCRDYGMGAVLRGEPGSPEPRHRPVVQAYADDARHCPTPEARIRRVLCGIVRGAPAIAGR